MDSEVYETTNLITGDPALPFTILPEEKVWWMQGV